MKNYAILRDAIDEKVFGLVIENNGGYQFHGADERSREWAAWANSTSVKSLVGALPVGVTPSAQRPLIHDSEAFVQGLIEAASNNNTEIRDSYSFKGSHVSNSASTTPSARDFQLRSFDIPVRQTAITFKALAFRSDQKASSLLAQIRSAGLSFNEKTGEFKTRNLAISHSAIRQDIQDSYTKSLRRQIGLTVTATKTINAKSLDAFYVHPSVMELKRLGGPLGSRLGRGLRSAPMGMVFVDVTGAIDADKDGIVFEGKPGLERPIIPKFILPEGVGRRVASLISGAAEDNERNRRAGLPSGNAIDEGKLREILGVDAASLSSLDSNVGDVLEGAPERGGMRSIAGSIRSRRDAIMGRRTSTEKLSRVGRGGKTQVNTGDSRAIEKMSWDDDAKELIVTFAGGRTYTYKGVDDSWVKEIENNPDALGRIMNDIKKAGYDFEAGGDHAPDSTLASRIQGRREAAGMRSMSRQKTREEYISETEWRGSKPSKEDLKPNANLGGADLSNQDLSNYDLSGASMGLADLSGSTLPISLTDAHLDEAILENVDGANSILNGASLYSADLSFSDFSDADLSDANLTDALFYKTNLSGANLELARADLSLFDEANLEGANLENITAKRASFKNANMRRANLGGADLKLSNLASADLTSADLSDATLDGVNLRGANLESANLGGAEFLGADLRDANLRAADLSEADLRKSDLRGADLSDADLRDADLTDTNIDEADFDGANLEGALLPKGWDVIDGKVQRIDEGRMGMESMRSRRGGKEFSVLGTPGVTVFDDRQIKITENEDGTFNAFTIENVPGTDGAYALQVGDNNYPNLNAAKRAANREKFGNSRGYGRSGGDGQDIDLTKAPGKTVFDDNSIMVTENEDGTFNAFTVHGYPGSDGGYLRQVGDDVYESLDEAKNAARSTRRDGGMRSERAQSKFLTQIDRLFPPKGSDSVRENFLKDSTVRFHGKRPRKTELEGELDGGKKLAGADLRFMIDQSNNLSGADLRGVNLSEQDLSQINLEKAKGTFIDLRGTDLSRANLRNSEFPLADMRLADISRGYLTGADLTDADLRGAIANGADFRGANLDGADLTGAILDDARFDGAKITGRTKIDSKYRSRALEQATRPSSSGGMESTRSTDARPQARRFIPDIGSTEDYIASAQYEADLEAFLAANPRKTERDYRMSRAFADNFGDFNPPSDFERERTSDEDYEGWTQEEIDAGLPDILRRGMESRKSTLTPEGKTAINEATKRLADFASRSSFGDVYPGAERFDKNNERHQLLDDIFEDADMPPHRVQDVLNAMQALKEVLGEDSDVGYSDRMTYVLDHIAPTFDARIKLSKGIRSSREMGMESRLRRGATGSSGFSGRSRTAAIERTAIASPTGMSSARRATIYKNHEKVPGQQKVGVNDGQLWSTLSPADRELFAKRARARESQIIEMLQKEFDLPISGTDRRLQDPTLSAKERAKILKSTGGGNPWVISNPDAPEYHLLNDEGLDSVFYGEYSVQRIAKALADKARAELEAGNMKEHKDTVAKLNRLLRLSDDLQTLAGARLQGEADDTLVDKFDSYDLAIDHLHPFSKESIMNVSLKPDKNDSTDKKKSKTIYEIAGADKPFEFKFTSAQRRAKSTAIEVPGRPMSPKYDFLRQAGVRDGEGNIAQVKRGKIGRFAEFIRVKFTDLSKADEKAREKRIAQLRKQGINIGSVYVGRNETDRPTLLDKRAMKISAANRKKLLNSGPRSIEKLNKSATQNNMPTAVVAQTEDGKTLLTPDGITALAAKLKPGEKEWRKTYRNDPKKGDGTGHALAFVWTAAGFNGTPHAVNEAEFTALVEEGWRPIKRGTGTRGYGISYLDDPKRFLPPAAEAYGPGEYWSTGTNMNWTGPQYYPEPNGELGDGPGGLAGLLPPTAKIGTKRDIEAIRADHRKISSPILGTFAGYPGDEWAKAPQDEFVDTLTKNVFDKIPRDSEVWDSAIGQMTLQLIQALESNPTSAEYAQLRDALFRLTSLVNQEEMAYAPLFGYDAVDVGGDVILLMNRGMVTVFADPLPVNAVVSLNKGNGLPPGYTPPGK